MTEFTELPGRGHLLTIGSGWAWVAFALLWEDSRGRELLPPGRLGPAQHATRGSLALHLRHIERQADFWRTP